MIFAGLANIYTSYVTTPEEYEIQRYEGASTIYGPHTLTLYIDQYQKLVTSMVKNEVVEHGPTPPFMDDDLLSLTTGVIFDGHPIGRGFGTLKVQPNASYRIGDTVTAKFIAANPRNNLMHGRTYMTVERISTEAVWNVVATDASWETMYAFVFEN